MSSLNIDWSPDDRKLRQFGWAGLAGFTLIGFVTAWRIGAISGAGSWTPSRVLWVLAVVCGILSITQPRLLKPLFIALTVITYPIGLVVNFAILAIVYFGLFTPIGLFFRIIGRDPLRRRMDRSAASCWMERDPPPDAARYYRQY